MKKTFYAVLSSTFRNNQRWDYYNKSHDFGEEFPFLNERASRTFLQNFIKVSGKAESLLSKEIEKTGNRAIHSVSAFLIGHYIYQNTILKEKIDNEIVHIKKQFSIENAQMEFSYFWFLICLFHDIGHAIESNHDNNYNSFEKLVQKSQKLDEFIGVPEVYYTVYKNYFNFRLKYNNKIDHGIVAAHILFNVLCKIRQYSEGNNESNLYWGNELENVYNYCSWNILSHNIWYVNELDGCMAQLYRLNNLDKLIIEKGEYKIKIDNHPFLFLLCLVDTLEPFKRLKNIHLLKKVSIEIADNNLIKISSNLNCSCRDMFLNQVLDLNNWLIKTEMVNGSVEINLTP